MSEKFVPFLPPHLNIGSNGKAVKFVQRCLKGWLGTDAPKGFIADSDYGDKTAKAVMTLQRSYLASYTGEIDGNFGPETREAILTDLDFDFGAIPLENVTAVTHWAGPDHEGLLPWPPAEEVVTPVEPASTDQIEVNGELHQLVELG